MKTLHAWITLFRFVSRYLFFKLRLTTPPDVSKHYDGLLYLLGIFTKWNRHIRIRGGENVPLDHPTVFCANHVMLGDPLYVYKAVYMASEGKITPSAMTRDDFFIGTPLKTRFFDADDLMTYVGIQGISRGNVTLPQMKTFVNLLLGGTSFLMFPGRTRSRSGLMFEYRGDVVEPGGASFFINMAQRRKKDQTCSVTPLSRNYNPARDHTTMIFGEPEFLVAKASKEEMRDFDFQVVEKIAMLSEVCVPQVVSALIYTVCLHQLTDALDIDTLKQWVRTIREASTHPYWDEEDDADLDAAVVLAVRFLQGRGFVLHKGNSVSLNTERILKVSETDAKLMKTNPVKFLTNKLLHLAEITEAIQDVVLASEYNQSSSR